MQKKDQEWRNFYEGVLFEDIEKDSDILYLPAKYDRLSKHY